MVGESAVGKTAIIHQFINNEFSKDAIATTAVKNQKRKFQMPPGSKVKEIVMDVWDTAGQEEYQPMNRNFFAGSHCVILAFAVDRPSTFQAIDQHLNSITQYCDENVLKILVGNKADLEERHISFDDISDKAEELKIKFFETSAIPEKKSTIDELFTEIANLLVQKGTGPRGSGGSFKMQC